MLESRYLTMWKLLKLNEFLKSDLKYEKFIKNYAGTCFKIYHLYFKLNLKSYVKSLKSGIS